MADKFNHHLYCLKTFFFIQIVIFAIGLKNMMKSHQETMHRQERKRVSL